MKKKILYISLSIIVLIILIVGSGFGILYQSVSQRCENFTQQYTGTCQDALVAVLDDEKATIQMKNDAIWAMGQFADPTYIPELEKLYSGSVPDHKEPLDEVISQYEIKKALTWMREGSVVSWMYGRLKD